MKTLTIIFAIFFSYSFSFVAAQSEMTTIKSFQLANINGNLELGFSADSFKVVTWDEEIVRLEITISSNVSEELLRRLVTLGRYELSLINHNFLMTKTANTVIGKGVQVTETFKVKVFVPKGFSFQIFPSLAHR